MAINNFKLGARPVMAAALLAVVCGSASGRASAGVTILPGQSTNIAGIEVTCLDENRLQRYCKCQLLDSSYRGFALYLYQVDRVGTATRIDSLDYFEINSSNSQASARKDCLDSMASYRICGGL